MHISEESKSGSTSFWNSLLGSSEVEAEVKLAPVDPVRCEAPVLRHAEIAASYAGMRMAGDFYEFLRVGPSRMLFVLLDMAGLRADTREILIAVQNTFRTRAPALFAGEDFNETTAMIALCNEMNRTILRSGVRSCPAFIGCYNEDLGTVCYANAGHTAGLLRDRSGVTTLEATGLPLGLFSHTTQSAAACHLVPSSALLVVSRGIVEADYHDPDAGDEDEAGKNLPGTEFGLDGAKECLLHAGSLSAYELCMAMLQAARKFAPSAITHNDLTTLALVRNADAGLI
jgi:serine phosphatase RsbU (regulator of sigma subunit)